jgi:hypothetical protein
VTITFITPVRRTGKRIVPQIDRGEELAIDARAGQMIAGR